MKQYTIGFLTLALLTGAVAIVPSNVHAQAPDRAALLAQIEQLMQVLATLQAQMQAIRGEVEDLKAGLSEGMQDDDIKKVQELLASDPTLYPGAQVTGYFGPMTKEALKRFQERYELEVTGRLDDPTREAIKALRKERVNDRIPAGLLTSEAARARVRERLQEKWGECDFTRPLREQVCKKIKDKNDDDSSDDTKSDSKRKGGKKGYDYYGTGNDVDGDDDFDSVSSKDISKARRAVARAEARLKVLERIIAEKDYNRSINQRFVKIAEARIAAARLKLRAALAAVETNPSDAEDLAEDAEDLIADGAEAIDEEDMVDAAGDDEEDDSDGDDDSEDNEDNDESDNDDEDQEDTDDDNRN